MDKNGVVLNAPQIPLVKSRYLEYITGEENLYGQNVIVAIMSHTGYNVEDSILFNEGSLQRGLFRTTYYNTYQTFEEKSKVSENLVEKIFTDVMTDGRVIKNKPGYDYSHLDEKGIIKEGTLVDDKIIMIGLTTNDLENVDKRIDNSVPCKKGQLGVVDKTFITEGEEGHRIAKVRIREERIPAIGYKMASRNGQKGTVGLIIPEKDMPFTKDGIRPDMIINPHAIPSRMTIGQLLETLLSKGAVVYGAFGDCTAFNNQEINKTKTYGEHLNKMGYHSSGNEIMYNGMSGEQIEMEVFIGPTYYMRLKHMVKDKINYRALGPNAALTRQPVSGRANDGGLRIGEMERDSMAGHGITHFLKESMMERADKYFMAVCNQTGMIAIYNPSKNLFLSPMADGPIKFTGVNDDLRLERITRFGREFSIVAIPYSMKLFIQELQAMNIQMRIITEDNIEQIENIIGEKHIPIEKIVENITKKNPIAKKGGGKSIELPTIMEDESFQESEAEAEAEEGAKSDAEYKSIELIRDEEEEPVVNESDVIDAPFKIGETVYLRGDINPSRLWKIKNIGNKFVTIETDDTENIMSSDTIKVVSFLDIYSMSDVPQYEQQIQQQQQQQQPQIQQQPIPTQQPSINIKFVNGPDHSIESPQQPVEIIPTNETMTESVRQGKNESDRKEEMSGGDSIDFSKKLIIHKI
jgi:hypothetical protein